MAGAYCQYCGNRCFVYRQVLQPLPGAALWSGHMATCAEGKAHDRAVLGQDADSAHNPAASHCARCGEPKEAHDMGGVFCP